MKSSTRRSELLKKMVMTDKEFEIWELMKLISVTYRPESGVYQKVKRGLAKMTKDEISGLRVMISTSTAN